MVQENIVPFIPTFLLTFFCLWWCTYSACLSGGDHPRPGHFWCVWYGCWRSAMLSICTGVTSSLCKRIMPAKSVGSCVSVHNPVGNSAEILLSAWTDFRWISESAVVTLAEISTVRFYRRGDRRTWRQKDVMTEGRDDRRTWHCMSYWSGRLSSARRSVVVENFVTTQYWSGKRSFRRISGPFSVVFFQQGVPNLPLSIGI